MEQRSCYVGRYCNLYSETTTDNPTSDGETILFYVCRVLNTTVWPQLIDSNMDEFTAINSSFDRFKLMLGFESVTCKVLQSGCADITCYVHQ